ncbi:hypothetical protein Tco_1383746 [Tanacetum coccineum]
MQEHLQMLFTMRETYVDRNPKSHKVLGIAPVVIIDRQLPFEYTITSRSSDVVVMAQPVQNINHSAFRSMFEREKLSGTNFNDCLCRLKLVLRVENKMFVIEQPIPPASAADSEANVLAEWNAIYDAYNKVACLMLGSMTPELHRQFENYSPYDMLQELKSMFEKQARVERFDLIQTFHACKQEEGKPVGAYVLKMKDYVEQLERLGKTIGELHAMLIEYEKGLLKKAKTPQVMMIKSGKIQKANKKSLKAKGKGNANGKGKDKQVVEKKKQVGISSSLCIFTIELFAFPNKSWVYDTGCGTHICITKHGFREARKLKQGALCLYVGNGVRAQVEAIRSFDLVLPNGLVICVDNCHYAPVQLLLSTHTSRSTDVVVMAQLVQNINHSAFRSMFEREKLSGNNFNDWFRQLKLVLRVEKKMFFIEQPLPAAPAADLKHKQFKNSSPYDMIKELKSMFEKQAGVERSKGILEQLKCLGYVLPQDFSVGLILNGITRDFGGFVRNYNMHNMGKTIGEIHALLIEKTKEMLKAKGNGKANGKGKDNQVYIPMPKNPKPSAKDHPAKDGTCHHYKEVGH